MEHKDRFLPSAKLLEHINPLAQLSPGFQFAEMIGLKPGFYFSVVIICWFLER